MPITISGLLAGLVEFELGAADHHLLAEFEEVVDQLAQAHLLGPAISLIVQSAFSPTAAAETLLANYRSDSKGERAQDSLYYLGQALMKLGQPGQACKAYGELQDVYGATIRAPLRKDLPAARAAANCSSPS